MQVPDKVIILENDTESQGLPQVMKIVLETFGFEHREWFNFSYSFYPTHYEGAIRQLRDISEEKTLCLALPSFSGSNNDFKSYFNLFNKLKELDIKLRIVLIYYKSFYSKVLQHLHGGSSMRRKSEIKETEDKLKAILEFHEIYYAEQIETHANPKNLFERAQPLTWESLYANYHKNYDIVRVKATGEKMQVAYGSTIDAEDPMLTNIELVPIDFNFDNYSSKNTTHVTLGEIEKVQE